MYTDADEAKKPAPQNTAAEVIYAAPVRKASLRNFGGGAPPPPPPATAKAAKAAAKRAKLPWPAGAPAVSVALAEEATGPAYVCFGAASETAVAVVADATDAAAALAVAEEEGKEGVYAEVNEDADIPAVAPAVPERNFDAGLQPPTLRLLAIVPEVLCVSACPCPG